MNVLGRSYNEIPKPDAAGCSLFLVSPQKMMTLPPPRKLLPEEVHEENGRTSYFLDGRITIGCWFWRRTVEILLNR